MIGRRLDHYELQEKLGEGGMGVVYRARDERLGRLVAVKILPPDAVADPDRKDRAVREAKAASSLNHPNIVTIYDIGSCDGSDYIAMEFVVGQTLAGAIPAGGMPAEEALPIARQVGAALEAAHAAGVIHRDLKPGNVMIGPKGVVKILDFGVAKLVRSQDAAGLTVGAPTVSFTHPGSVVGTPAYMSPEQAEGRPVDQRSDIFSFGVLLYEMLSGESPFKGGSMAATLAAVLRERPPVLPGVAPSLAAIVERCLEKDRERRFPSASALLAALTAITTPPGAPAAPFIAVLPFANLSPDTANEYFCDGLSEEILNLLARSPDLRVIARTSAFALKRTTQDVQAIGAKLGVDTLLAGSVRTSGNRLRITAQLVNVADGRSLWSSSYDRMLVDVFEVQEEIATEVVHALLGQLRRATRSSEQPAREAHDAYLRGRYHWNKFTLDSMRKAMSFFELAIERDPGYALPYAGLADCYLQFGHSRAGFLPPLEAMPKARVAAERALSLDDRLAEAHTSLATYLYWHAWDWAGAEREFRRANELNPSYAINRQWYALFLATMRRFGEAEAEIQRAQQLDPLSPLVATYFGAVPYLSGDYPLALERFEQLLQMEPDYPWALYWLALVHGEQGRRDLAIEMLRRAIQLAPAMMAGRAKLGYFLGTDGQDDRAREVLADLDRLSATGYVDKALRAWVHLGMNEIDTAVELYEAAFRERSALFCLLAVDPPTAALRGLPRFEDLMRRLDLPFAV